MSEDEDDQKRICHGCVGEAYLAEQIVKGGELGTCSYCGDTQVCNDAGCPQATGSPSSAGAGTSITPTQRGRKATSVLNKSDSSSNN
ncbi:MAG: hypothetical protein EDS66_15110 [Planctomycetota bacterium]|nr:MAG: hypothetical protein EDS66_15110 [Planctomycetota bacterium]